jgi:predicted NodU family carbamoyl transferase
VHPGPTVLGINAAHNAAACLMVRGRIVAAVAGSGSTFIAKRLPKPERSN